MDRPLCPLRGDDVPRSCRNLVCWGFGELPGRARNSLGQRLRTYIPNAHTLQAKTRNVSEDADHLLRRVGLRIQKRRQELGQTQQQLANELEMDQSSLAKIEQGKQNLTVRTLAKLANVLGVK